MKKVTYLKLTTLSFIGLIMLSGCAKMPQAEIDAAKIALESAKAAGADLYAKDVYISLQDSLNAVMVEVEAQKSKLFKNYDIAKVGLAGVAQYADEVKQIAETHKEELKAEIQRTIDEVKTLIAANKELILKAPKGKEGTSALVAIKDELNTVEMTINEASIMFDTGNYIATLDKAKAAKVKASSINEELTEAIAKYKKRS